MNKSNRPKRVRLYVFLAVVLIVFLIIFLASPASNSGQSVFSGIADGYNIINRYTEKSLWDAFKEAQDKDIFDTGSALAEHAG